MKLLHLALLSSVAAIASGASPSPAEAQAKESDLVVELKNCRIVGEDSAHIEVDFVMTNKALKPLVLAERWNSWGASQWSFTLTDAKANVIELTNPQMAWWCNYLTTFEVPAEKSLAFKCHLSVRGSNFGDATCFGFSSSTDVIQLLPMSWGNGPPFQTEPMSSAWVYPIKLKGTFSAPLIHRTKMGDRTIETNWTGKVTTPTINLEEIEQAVPSDGHKPSNRAPSDRPTAPADAH